MSGLIVMVHLSAAVLLALTLVPQGARAYPTGATLSECDSMMPNHRTASAQPANVNVPFTITPSKMTYYGGEKIMVTVTGGNTMFKGLLLKAMTSSASFVGSFSATSQGSPVKFLGCSNMQNSAVTHTNRDLKTSVVFYWTAPSASVGNVTFRATVVQQFDTFFVGVTSEPVAYMMMNNSMMTPESMPTTTTMMNNNNNNNITTPGNNGMLMASSIVVTFACFFLSQLA
ncbi:hypothetical protein ACOMHN_061312 [Nucella lapillus]